MEATDKSLLELAWQETTTARSSPFGSSMDATWHELGWGFQRARNLSQSERAVAESKESVVRSNSDPQSRWECYLLFGAIVSCAFLRLMVRPFKAHGRISKVISVGPFSSNAFTSC